MGSEHVSTCLRNADRKELLPQPAVILQRQVQLQVLQKAGTSRKHHRFGFKLFHTWSIECVSHSPAVILQLFLGSIISYLILQKRQEGGTAPLICGAAPAGSAHRTAHERFVLSRLVHRAS